MARVSSSRRPRGRRARNVAGVVGVSVLAAGVLVLWLWTSSAGRSATTVPSSTGASAAAATTVTTVDPGALPQTDTLPVATAADEQNRARQLLAAVVADNPDAAIVAFFPRAAYLQVKALTNAGGDYDQRLVAQFRADVHARHAQVVAGARSTPEFVRLDVVATPVWVVPGVESNKGSYWRVYDSQLRYTVDGTDRSLPIKSLISWRGQWYVVHLVAVK